MVEIIGCDRADVDGFPAQQPVRDSIVALYPRLVGDAWADLDASVQHWHSTAHQVQGTGLFTIRHGQGCLARCLAWLLRLPRQARSLPRA